MIRRQGRVAIAEPSRHLQRLCYHFQRKIEVSYDAHQGRATFPWGSCLLQADSHRLHFDCRAPDTDALARVQAVIDAHVELFSRKQPVLVDWDAPHAWSPTRDDAGD